MNDLVKADPRVGTVRQLLDQIKPQMALALPRHITADRMARVVMSQIQLNPKLLDCDKTSLLSSVMTAAQLGLEPDGVLGHGYLVPFAGKCQFIPGYRGYIKLARQSGEVSDLYAMDVRKNDDFKVTDGLNRNLEHVRAEGDRGPVIGFYAVAKYVNGGFDFKYMPVEEVNAIRDTTQGWKAFKAGKIKETPWDGNYNAMGMKTVIRQLAKYLPLSVQKAAALEDQYDMGKAAVIDGNDLIISSALEDPEDVKAAEEAKKAPAKTKLDKFAGKEPKAEDDKLPDVKMPDAEKPEPEFEGPAE
jgi:recombination protein RecT